MGGEPLGEINRSKSGTNMRCVPAWSRCARCFVPTWAKRTSLAVGTDRVELEREQQRVVERKVRLPTRWVKGFAEVQSHQARLKPVLDVRGEQAWRFLRTLPRTVPPGPPAYVVASGPGLRLSQRGRRGREGEGHQRTNRFGVRAGSLTRDPLHQCEEAGNRPYLKAFGSSGHRRQEQGVVRRGPGRRTPRRRRSCCASERVRSPSDEAHS